MFHELIMALNGYAGDIFQLDSQNFIKARKDLAFPVLHPGEMIIVNELLEIATLYKNLETFVQSQLMSFASTNTLENQSQPPPLQGLYVTAVSNGIRVILDEYLDMLADMELRVIEDSQLSLSHIRASVEHYRSVFLSLNGLIAKVKSQSKSSALIVEIVKTEYDEKLHLQDQLYKLIPWINRTLYKQITNWVVYGALADPYKEFFIKIREDETEVEHTSSKPGENYLVDYTVVPSHFSVTLMQRILFVGDAISILEKSDRTKSAVLTQQKEFYLKMKSLKVDNFRVEPLSNLIDELATEVGKELHHLVAKEADLVKHLGIIKDFYLTGRGELFHDFLSSLKPMTLVKNSVLSEFRSAFAVSAARVQLQEDILQKLELVITSDIPKGSLTDYISKLSLKIQYEWPLHIFFTTESQTKYNELFRFLLKVRLLQMELNMIWVNTRKIFRFPIPNGPAELKNVMSFFIDHLQHYLQEDVLENQYAILINTVEKSETFEQIRVAHVNFQSAVLTQSFRTNKKVCHFVEELLRLGFQYTAFMNYHIEQCELKDVPINEGISKEILEFSSNFKMSMELLLNLLRNLAGQPQSGQYLGQFLLRLDFNSYFTAMTALGIP